jgi:hypothetical protein
MSSNSRAPPESRMGSGYLVLKSLKATCKHGPEICTEEHRVTPAVPLLNCADINLDRSAYSYDLLLQLDFEATLVKDVSYRSLKLLPGSRNVGYQHPVSLQRVSGNLVSVMLTLRSSPRIRVAVEVAHGVMVSAVIYPNISTMLRGCTILSILASP